MLTQTLTYEPIDGGATKESLRGSIVTKIYDGTASVICPGDQLYGIQVTAPNGLTYRLAAYGRELVIRLTGPLPTLWNCCDARPTHIITLQHDGEPVDYSACPPCARNYTGPARVA